MSKTLATAVHLTDDSGVVHSFLPGQTPPKWARKRIDNPKAWAEDGSTDDDSSDAADDSTETDGSTEDDSESSDGSTDSADDKSGGVLEVPRKNASTDAWRAYADSKGFETDEDITRAEIIAGLAAAGIPTE